MGIYYHLPMRFKVDPDTEETGVLEDNQLVTNAKRSRARAQRPTYESIVKLAMETVQVKPMLPKESSNNVSKEPFGFIYQEHPLFVKQLSTHGTKKEDPYQLQNGSIGG